MNTSEKSGLSLALLWAPWTILLTSVFCVCLAEPYLMGSTFCVYFIGQLLLLALAFILRKDALFILGASLGAAFCTAISAYHELRWYAQHIAEVSMPFFGYVFIELPIIALGIIAANIFTRQNSDTQRRTVLPMTFACTSIVGWIYLFAMLRHT